MKTTVEDMLERIERIEQAAAAGPATFRESFIHQDAITCAQHSAMCRFVLPNRELVLSG